MIHSADNEAARLGHIEVDESFGVLSMLSHTIRILLVTICILMSFLAKADNMDEQDSINNISFSPDGKKLIFDRCPQGKCAIHVYDLKTKDFGYYQAPEGEFWSMGSYSHDGNRIVFSRIPRDVEGKRVLERIQIAVMRSDGSEVQTITHGEGPKIYPSFSNSGEKIIYTWGGLVTKTSQWVSETLKKKMPASDYDLFEVTLKDGMQIQLTDYGFNSPPRSSYMLDDNQFIFSGEWPKRYSTLAPKLKGNLLSEQVSTYEHKFGRNRLYLLAPGISELVPYTTLKNERTDSPRLDRQGDIYFSGAVYFYKLSNDKDVIKKWHIFPDGWELTDVNCWSYDISPDGQLAVLVLEKGASRFREGGSQRKIGLRNLNDNSFVWLELPAKAHRIN